MGVHVALLAYAAFRDSPTYDEAVHLPAGVSHWQFGRYELYRVNPPLVRMVAALPVLAAGSETEWPAFDRCPAPGRSSKWAAIFWRRTAAGRSGFLRWLAGRAFPSA